MNRLVVLAFLLLAGCGSAAWAGPAPDSLVVVAGFSPNGDGVNDTFGVTYDGPEPITLEVYNRWGSLVFGSENYQGDWDGSSNQGRFLGESRLPAGTYYFVVRAGRLRKSGTLTLHR